MTRVELHVYINSFARLRASLKEYHKSPGKKLYTDEELDEHMARWDTYHRTGYPDGKVLRDEMFRFIETMDKKAGLRKGATIASFVKTLKEQIEYNEARVDQLESFVEDLKSGEPIDSSDDSSQE